MKNLILLFLFSFALTLGVDAQRGAVKTITVDTVMGDEDIYLTAESFTGSYESLTFQLLATRISTAAGGTAYFQGSVDGVSYTNLSWHEGGCLECWFGSSAADSSCSKAFADVATQTFQVKVDKSPWKYYRWYLDGDASDTVKVLSKYIFK